MPKKKHGRGRDRQPQRRDPSSRPARQPHGEQDQQLFQGLRQALRSAEPLDLLAIVSGFLEVTDPRSRDPFAPDEQRASLEVLVESFIGTPYAETTAALTAIKALVADELLAVRIGRELEARRHPLPDWLIGLDQARLDPDVWFLTHVLGDGDDYLLGVTLPSGHSLSALVYIDHNLGTVVKDAFIVPEPLEDLAIKMGTLLEDADQSLTRTDPAAARPAIEAAIASGVGLYPPIQSDSWPMCRPMVEWMLRMLPAGGVAPELTEWSSEETEAVAAAFFASPFGVSVDRDDERGLLESVVWFGTGYATGDPWRWSPVTVEMLLVDWFPRKVIAEPSYLAKLPDLLRAYIRYCHDRNEIRADLTAETLAAVDHHEPEYVETHDKVREVAAALEGYGLDAHQVIKAPAKVRGAYLLLPALADRHGAILEARRVANSIGHRSPQHDDAYLFGIFRKPLAFFPGWRLPARIPMLPFPEDRIERLLWMVGPEAKAAEPWLPTIAEQDASWLAQFEELAPKAAPWNRVVANA